MSTLDNHCVSIKLFICFIHYQCCRHPSSRSTREQTPSVCNYTSEEPSDTQSEISQDSQKVTKVNSECGKLLISDTALVVTIVT